MVSKAAENNTATVEATPDAVRQFQPVRDYDHPSMPAVDTLQRITGRFRELLQRSNPEPTMRSDKLRKLQANRLDEVMSPPACGPLINELQASLAGWVATEKPDSWLQLVILPPCDENGILETWARDGGHHLLAAPSRSELLDGVCAVPDFTVGTESGSGVLVIPHLEHWFLRHQRGLGDIRALLAQLQSIERHCVVGCNSWAWAFLSKVVQANTLLPEGITFQAFDATRLHRWFLQLNNNEKYRILSSQSGTDLLGEDSDSDYFKPLAARSQGIPWVAWHLWRRSLRSGIPEEEVAALAEESAVATPVVTDQETLWVAALEEFSLPGKDSQTTLLVLQALLIHGSLSLTELNLVLPLSDQNAAVAALTKAGFVEKIDHQLRLIAAAYPAIRSGLKTAGFPLDEL